MLKGWVAMWWLPDCALACIWPDSLSKPRGFVIRWARSQCPESMLLKHCNIRYVGSADSLDLQASI